MADGTIHLLAPSLRNWVNYLDRLESEPTAKTRAGLDAVMDMAFIQTQVSVHVQTGRLRASGYRQTDTRRSPRTSRYTGIISYGRGLDYSQYEMGDRRHGVREDWAIHPPHDPYDGLEVYYAGIEAVLKAI